MPLMPADLAIRIGRLRLANPVLTASGCFGYGLEAWSVFDVSRLGALVMKTLTARPRLGNPPPRIAETPAGMLNAIGLENPGMEAFLRDILPKSRELGCPVLVASVAGKDLAEYATLTAALQVKGISAVELNLSCPNLNSGGIDFGGDAAFVREATRRCLKASPKRDLWVKLTPHTADIRVTARAAWEAGAAAVTVANTYVGMSIDWKRGVPRTGHGTGGLSGPAIRPLTVALVAKVAADCEVPIVASGGISSPQDAMEYAWAGASAVQVGTASFRDPAACLRILEGIPDCLKQAKATRWRNVVGRLKRPQTGKEIL